MCLTGCRRYLQWADGVSLTIYHGRFIAWDLPTAPRIRNISTSQGCGNVLLSNNVTLGGCHGGELLQLYGTQFNSASWVMAILATTSDDFDIINSGYIAICEQLNVVSDSYATCVLPQVQDYAQLRYDTPYMMLLYNDTGEWWPTPSVRSNALFFTFASSASTGLTDTSSAPSRNLSLLIALPVALGVLGGLLVVTIVRRLRCRAKSTRNTLGGNSVSSDGYGEDKQTEGGVSGKWWQPRVGSQLTLQGEMRGVELS